jgi:hypothetical protein
VHSARARARTRIDDGCDAPRLIAVAFEDVLETGAVLMVDSDGHIQILIDYEVIGIVGEEPVLIRRIRLQNNIQIAGRREGRR